MSNITNKAERHDDEKANILRGAIETRAGWMALFYDEACKAGLQSEGEEILRKAIRRFGTGQGIGFKKALEDESGSIDMAKFAHAFGSPTAVNAFEAQVGMQEEGRLDVVYHFCPLLKSWQDLGFDDERCSLLCDIAMEGDRHMSQGMGLDFELTDTIADGCPTCSMYFSCHNTEK